MEWSYSRIVCRHAKDACFRFWVFILSGAVDELLYETTSWEIPRPDRKPEPHNARLSLVPSSQRELVVSAILGSSLAQSILITHNSTFRSMHTRFFLTSLRDSTLFTPLSGGRAAGFLPSTNIVWHEGVRNFNTVSPCVDVLKYHLRLAWGQWASSLIDSVREQASPPGLEARNLCVSSKRCKLVANDND